MLLPKFVFLRFFASSPAGLCLNIIIISDFFDNSSDHIGENIFFHVQAENTRHAGGKALMLFVLIISTVMICFIMQLLAIKSLY